MERLLLLLLLAPVWVMAALGGALPERTIN